MYSGSHFNEIQQISWFSFMVHGSWFMVHRSLTVPHLFEKGYIIFNYKVGIFENIMVV